MALCQSGICINPCKHKALESVNLKSEICKLHRGGSGITLAFFGISRHPPPSHRQIVRLFCLKPPQVFLKSLVQEVHRAPVVEIGSTVNSTQIHVSPPLIRRGPSMDSQ